MVIDDLFIVFIIIFKYGIISVFFFVFLLWIFEKFFVNFFEVLCDCYLEGVFKFIEKEFIIMFILIEDVDVRVVFGMFRDVDDYIRGFKKFDVSLEDILGKKGLKKVSIFVFVLLELD